MDAGYIVIAVFLGFVGLFLWARRGHWNGKRDEYRHNPMPGHRQGGASGGTDPYN